MRAKPRFSHTFMTVLLLASVPVVASAQTDVEELGRRYGATPPARYYEILRTDPNAFQFSPENGWVRRGKRIAAFRNWLRGSRDDGLLMTQAAHDVGGVMMGDVYVPVFLILFSDIDSLDVVSHVPRTSLETRLYGTDPAPPYSVHTYYREVSNDRVNVYGTVFDWAFVPGDAYTYEGDDNGFDRVRMGQLMSDAAAVLDDSVDFGLFDNDGPDGIPNSADDDGFVDAVVMIHPKVDGSCMAVNPEAQNSIWAHRWSAEEYGYTSNDLSVATGESIRLNDYIIQGGQGGDGGCTSDQPQSMGVVAHETGHLFGLDDLYDTIDEGSGGDGAGIGRWGLMGSGNHLTPDRPAHLNAYSKAQLGWVTEVSIEADTTFEMNPIENSYTTYILPIPNTTEYFLLENRQRIGSDINLYEEGLLIWHVDSLLAFQRGNDVNAFRPYAVALEQADGRDDLIEGTNRGDRGDPFPGSTGNRVFGRNTTPSSRANDGTLSFVEVDSIAPVGTSGAIRLRIGFERPSLIAATDTNAVIRLDDIEYNRFTGYLTPGDEYQLDIESPQTHDSGRRRFEWISWSNGMPRSHVFTATPAGDTITANVAAEYQLIATTSGTGVGVLESEVSLDLLNGTFLGLDSVVTLVAVPGAGGHVFEGWFGSDTTAVDDTLLLRMSRPFALDARFAAPLVLADESIPTATMGTEYRHQLTATGGVDGDSWDLDSGSLPEGMALSASGLLAGLPEQTGEFALGIAVTSGSQTVVDTLDFSVVAPSLVAGELLQHLVGEGESLSAQDIAYLDLLGNRNSWFDVGDFLAWVEATDASISQAAAAVLQRAGGASGATPVSSPAVRKGERP